MLIEVLGILDDGGRPINATMPSDRRFALEIQQSDDVTVRVTLKNWGGAPVNLAGSDHLVLSARSIPSPGQRKLFTKTSSRAAKCRANVHDIVISAADTRPLTITRGLYDIFAIVDGKKPCVIPTSFLIIRRATADLSGVV